MENPLTVLVAEDDDLTREGLVEVLRAEGYHEKSCLRQSVASAHCAGGTGDSNESGKSAPNRFRLKAKGVVHGNPAPETDGEPEDQAFPLQGGHRLHVVHHPLNQTLRQPSCERPSSQARSWSSGSSRPSYAGESLPSNAIPRRHASPWIALL